MPLAPGTTLGPYEIQAPLGAGGLGEVYQARDTRLDRTVAIKVLPEHVAADPDLKQRFEREVRTVAALNHPHICTLFDIGREGETDFLVMEYLEGETLAQRLRQGALPLDQALTIAIEIADALDKAHRQGIVHRDLKPGNIMLTQAGATLLDFGLAKLKFTSDSGGLSGLATQTAGLTGEGSILGTLQYMAPEQLEGQEADARTDVLAFGTLVYEMVTGERTFTEKSQASLIGAILEREPAPISGLQPMSPPALERVVKKCLVKDPEGRWQSARDLHDELAWIAQGDAQAGVATPAAPTPAGWRHALSAVAAGVIASAIVGFAVWSLTRPAPDTPLRFALTLPASDTLTSFPNANNQALSPDGQTVAYAATRDGTRQLYRRPLGQLEAVPIPGTEGARYPFFSPDGVWLGFELNGALKKLTLAGGPPVTVYEGPAPASDAHWGSNDMIAFGLANNGNPIMRVPAAGGVAEAVTSLAAGEGDQRQPQWLPGGTALLFSVATSGNSRVVVKSLETGERRDLLVGSSPRYVSTGQIVFAREGAMWAAPLMSTGSS